MDYPGAGTNMYLLGLGPDQVYQIRVEASSIWVPEERRWGPQVFSIREGIIFTVNDPVRLMYSLHKANVIAKRLGMWLYKE